MQQKIYTNNQIIRALGAGILILSLLFLLSPFTHHVWGIAFLFVYLFGLLGYWAFFPLALVFGVLLFVKGKDAKKILTWRIVVGIFVVLIGVSLIFGFGSANFYADNGLSLYDLYGTESTGLLASFAEMKGIINARDGGGIIYALIAYGINAAGRALTLTIAILVILVGLFFLFYPLIMRGIHGVTSKVGASRAKKQSDEEIRRQEEENRIALEAYVQDNQPIEVDEPIPAAQISYEVRPESPKGPVEENASRTSLYHSEGPKEVSPVPQEIAPVEPLREAVLAETEFNAGLQEAVFDPNANDIFSQPVSSPSAPSGISSNRKEIILETPKKAPAYGEVVLPLPGEEKPEPTPEKVNTKDAEVTWEEVAQPSEESIKEEKREETEETPQESFVSEEPFEEEEYSSDEEQEQESLSLAEPEPHVEPEPYVEPEPHVEPEPEPIHTAIPDATFKPEPMPEPKHEMSEEEKHGVMPAKQRPDYQFPPLDLLQTYKKDPQLEEQNKLDCQHRADIINETFADLHAGAQVVSYTVGPSVTRYDIQADRGVSVASIGRFVKDVSVKLGGVHTRYEEVILGKTTSGLEIANEKSTIVSLKEMVASLPDDPHKNMWIPFGINISGEPICADLSAFPHMLIAGTSGSGKSIFAHGILASLIMRNRPEDLKLVLVDPKRVEMVKYADIPHLLCPIIKEPSQAKVCLDKLIDLMEARLMLFEFAGVRDIRAYNEKYCPKAGAEPIPFIVVFIDEYADLSDTCKNIGQSVVRLAQKARAAGIHLIIATQRPSVNVITGVIKANLNVRVALRVSSQVDSGTILGHAGAEELNGHGDMLVDCQQISHNGDVRCQGCLVQDEELEAITDFIKKQQTVEYDPRFLDLTDHSNDEKEAEENEKLERAALKEKAKGDLYEQIKMDVMTQEYTSISKIQRTYSVGFPRAGKIFNQLIAEGIVAKADSQSNAKGSKVLIHDPSVLGNGNENFDGDND